MRSAEATETQVLDSSEVPESEVSVVLSIVPSELDPEERTFRLPMGVATVVALVKRDGVIVVNGRMADY